jgi:aminoglycoside phosphotransferase (APT) family kinase protein
MSNEIKIENVKSVLLGSPYEDYDVKPVDQGVSTDVFKLVKKAKTTLYFRVLPHGETSSLQCLAHDLMVTAGVKVPKVLLAKDKVADLDGRAFMLVEEIAGSSLTDSSRSLEESQKRNALVDTGKELALINSICVSGVGWLEKTHNRTLVARGRNYNDFAINSMDKMLGELVISTSITQSLANKTSSFVFAKQDLFDTRDASFLAHGDFGADHIYQDEGKYTGIIDFGDIRGTSKYHDLATFYTYDREYYSSLVEGYNQVYPLPPDYAQRILVEAVLFGIGKLWYLYKTRPDKVTGHPVIDLFNEVAYP